MADLARQELMQTLLTGLLLFGGYVYILQILIRRTMNRSAIPMIAAILLLIYGGISGFLVITFRNAGTIGSLLITVLLFMAMITLALMIRFLVTNWTEVSKGALALFAVYFLAVLYITLFGRNGGNDTSIRLQPFALISQSIQERNMRPLNHLLLNVAMFIPLGFLLPFVCPRKLARLRFAIPVGLLFSVMIESVQLLLKKGQCDVDDVIANTLGAVVGLALYMLYERLFKKQPA